MLLDNGRKLKYLEKTVRLTVVEATMLTTNPPCGHTFKKMNTFLLCLCLAQDYKVIW